MKIGMDSFRRVKMIPTRKTRDEKARIVKIHLYTSPLFEYSELPSVHDRGGFLYFRTSTKPSSSTLLAVPAEHEFHEPGHVPGWFAVGVHVQLAGQGYVPDWMFCLVHFTPSTVTSFTLLVR